MPTNEERRIIADYLRESNKTEFTTAEIELCEIAACVGCDSVTKLKTRLADLIEPEPERTCRIKQHHCTNCNHEIDDRAYFAKVVLDDGCWTAESRTANYCPNCGAKVIA